MWGLIDARHQAVFVDQSSGAVYRYSGFSFGGGKFSGGFVSFTPSSSPAGGAATVGSGTAHSSFSPGDSLTGYLAFSDASLPVFSFSDSYQPALYDTPAAFATIAGSYTVGSAPSSGSLVVAADGSFTLSNGSCSTAGRFSIPDAAHNAYELAGTQTCSGTALAVTGLASFTPAAGTAKATLTYEYDDGKTTAVQAAATR
jgi:hypothetical protein